MIVLDANIVVSAILGPYTRAVLNAAHDRGVRMGATAPQIFEAAHVLIAKLSMPAEEVKRLLEAVLHGVELVAEPAFAAFEGVARERLHARDQSDWPVLAAAMAFGAGVWSHDRDFFGVGVPVWSTRNMAFAEADHRP